MESSLYTKTGASIGFSVATAGVIGGRRCRLKGRVGVQPFSSPHHVLQPHTKRHPQANPLVGLSGIRSTIAEQWCCLQKEQISEEALPQLSARGLHLLQLIQCYGRLSLLQSTSGQLQRDDEMLVQSMKDSIAFLGGQEACSISEGCGILDIIGVRPHELLCSCKCSQRCQRTASFSAARCTLHASL